MDNLSNEEIKINKAIKTTKIAKILYLLTYSFGIFIFFVWLIGTIALAASSKSGVIGMVIILIIFFIPFIILAIASFILRIITIISSGEINSKYWNPNEGSGKLLIIIGFFVSFVAGVGLFMLEKELNKSLEMLKREQGQEDIIEIID